MTNLKPLNIGIGRVISIQEVCVIELDRTNKTLDDICSKYGFKDQSDLRRFCSNALYLFRVLDDQEKFLTQMLH